MYDEKKSFADKHEGIIIAAAILVLAIATLLIIIGAWLGIKAISRSQRLADERNQVQINEIQIQQTHQLVQVQQQKADIKIAEAKGIAESQSIIQNSLTPLYLQYEAIEAQKSMANSPNHTTIYIPSGNNGIPLVQPVNP